MEDGWQRSDQFVSCAQVLPEDGPPFEVFVEAVKLLQNEEDDEVMVPVGREDASGSEKR